MPSVANLVSVVLAAATATPATSSVSTATYSAYPSAYTANPYNTLANLTNYASPPNGTDYANDGPPLEVVHELYGDFPTGVAVDKYGRLFFNIPRSGGNTSHTVSLATNFTSEVAWPNQAIQNLPAGGNASDYFINAQSVVIDSTQERLWVLDTGMPAGTTKVVEYGAKVWAWNLTTAESIRKYVIPPSIAPTGSNISINDIRFNLSLSTAGVGFLSDEAGSLLTLDLDTGNWTRLLFNTSVTVPDVDFVGSYDGQPFYSWNGTTRSHVKIGADGIALQNGNLYFGPLASRRLYQVSQSDLLNTSLSATELLNSVEFIGQIGSYSEGFTADDQGRVFMGTAEQNSITYFNTSLSSLTNATLLNGLQVNMTGVIPATDISIEPFVRSAEIQWADSMCIESGYLWFTTNQLPLSPAYQKNGIDKRSKPFKVYRSWVGAGPAV